ncbi:MAG: DJ-1/PfpI family protein [Eubacteriales bacterium]|nr:DJ-1/PfpI family protein [Eubacteriales bacterium]
MIYTFLATGFEEVEALFIVDILRRAKIDISLVSINNEYLVQGSHNIKIKADYLINEIDFDKGAAIFLPGGMPGTKNLMECNLLCSQIKKYYEKNKYLCAICAAPSILGSLNILNGHEATCYPGFEKYFTKCKFVERGIIVSKNIITAPSVSYAEEMGLTMVEIFANIETRQKIEEELLSH